MNVTRIRAENFRSWRTLELDLTQGVTAITGQNGAGKTSLLSVIDTALFGAQGALRDYLSDGETTLLAEVEFEHGGETYRVRRSYTAKGGGKSTLDLDQVLIECDDPAQRSWDALTCETQKATQERICQLVGLTPATWESSAYLRQGGGSWADPSIPPRQRKEMLSQALGLDVWDRMLMLARGDRGRVEHDRGVLQGRIEAQRVIADGLAAAEAELAAARVHRDEAKAQADALKQQADEVAARIEQAMVDVIAANEARRPAVEAANDMAAHLESLAASKAADHARQEAVVQGYVAQRDRLRDEDSIRQRNEKSWHDQLSHTQRDHFDLRQRRLAISDSDTPTCHACGQHLVDEARERALADLDTSIAGRAEAAASYDLKRIEEHEAAMAARLALAALVAPPEPDLPLVHAAQQAAREARDEATRLAAETTRVPDSVAADKELVSTTWAEWQITNRTERVAEQDMAAAASRVEAARAAGDVAEAMIADHCDLETELLYLDVCIAAYGPNGIPALILETSAIPQIEQETNRVLAELGTEFRVELATQRAKRSSDGLIETLDVIVHSDQGARSFELFSGGEKTRINLALRLALAQLLAHRRGADVRVFLVDEPEGLDASGLERLSAVLQRLSSTFDRIMVISHHQDLRDSFDAVIEVERDGDGASVLVADRERVRS